MSRESAIKPVFDYHSEFIGGKVKWTAVIELEGKRFLVEGYALDTCDALMEARRAIAPMLRKHEN
jgi:hypothetical protein